MLGGVRAFFGVPEVRSRKIVREAGIENELGQETVLPLGFEEMPQLSCGAFLIVAAVADGDERRVPRPLVRIELGPGIVYSPVQLKSSTALA